MFLSFPPVEPASLPIIAAPHWVASESLLGTMSQIVAGFIAILGGLVVAQLLNRVSERGSAEQLLADARGRLETADQRAAVAVKERVLFEGLRLLRDRTVAAAVARGETRADALLDIYGTALVNEDELQPLINEAAAAAQEAHSVIDELLPAVDDMTPDQWGKHPGWDTLQPQIPVEIPPRHLAIWQASHALLLIGRTKEAKRRKQLADAAAASQSPVAAMIGVQLARQAKLWDVAGTTWMKSPDLLAPVSFPTPGAAQAAHRLDLRRSEMRANEDRTRERVEDIRAEVLRLESVRASLSRPNGQLVTGLAVLALGTVAGVIVPVLGLAGLLTVSRGWLVGLFIMSVGAPVVFIGWLISTALGDRAKRSRVASGSGSGDPRPAQSHVTGQSAVNDHQPFAPQPRPGQ